MRCFTGQHLYILTNFSSIYCSTKFNLWYEIMRLAGKYASYGTEAWIVARD